MKLYFLLLLVILETLCCTFFLESKILTELVAITYFICGIGIAVLPMFGDEQQTSNNRISIISKTHLVLVRLCFGVLGIVFIYGMYLIIQNVIISIYASDMLPQIQVMCHRLLHGERIYAPIQEIWNGKLPPYLPLMWLPYTITSWLQVDIRYTTMMFFLGAIFLLYLLFSHKQNQNIIVSFLSILSLFFLIYFLLFREKITLGHTEEGVVIFYYILLGYALIKKNLLLIGIAIACCLLSRFSLFFWVPMYLLFVFFYQSRQNAYIISIVILLVLFFVFLLPFGFKQPAYFLNIPADYHVGVDRAWGDNFKDGVYYGDFLGYTRYFDISQIKLVHNLHIIVSALLPFLLLLFYVILKRKLNFNTSFWGICTLKIVLVFFYNMIEVPYYYLFFVSTFFSYCILFSYRKIPRTIN